MAWYLSAFQVSVLSLYYYCMYVPGMNIGLGLRDCCPPRLILFFAAFGCISMLLIIHQHQTRKEVLFASAEDSAIPCV